MSPPDPRIEAIFHEALSCAAVEREAFIAEACVGDEELEREVRRLLAGHEVAGTFFEPLQTPEIQAELARLKPEEAGQRIGPYKLLEQIGEGGFGTVWVADQEKPVRRRVALKIIKLGMDTKEVIARFEQERQALAMMEHPHIARVLDAGATEWGRPYFVMELVRGIKITDYCDQANLPTKERLELFIQVCNAVQHAHQKGIIHRDLKPSNILVTMHDGVPAPKVIDFGVAKATQQQRLTDLTIYTQFEQMIGTPLYMAPEQAEMSGLDIDTRSDIYSLGVLLYELLVGRTPFDPETLMRAGLDEMRRVIREEEPQTPSMFLQTMADETRATVAQHRRSDPAKLARLVRGDLDWIVMKALEKDRTRRYETANGLAKDIERHLADEPVLARSPSQLYRIRRLVRRNKLRFAAAGAVALALLLAFIILAISVVRIIDEKNQKDIALAEKGDALREKNTALATAQDQLFSSLLNQARASRLSGRMGQRFVSLQAITEAARIRFDERLRDEATAATALPDVRTGAEWNFDGDECFDAAYRLSAKLDEKGIITIRSVPDGREIRRIETGSPNEAKGVGLRRPWSRWDRLLFSSDGGFLAQYRRVYSDEPVRVWRVTDGRSVLESRDPVDRDGIVCFSPDSRQLAIAQIGRKNWIACFDLETGQQTKRWEVSPHAMSLSFNPDSRQLAIGYIFGNNVSIYDTLEGTKLTDLDIGDLGTTCVAWHPDGRRLAVGFETIQMWDVPSKRRLVRMEGHAFGVSALSFHPNGEILASRSDEAVCRLWHVSTGRQLLQFPGLVEPFTFSADGRWLGHTRQDQGGRLLEVYSGREYRALISTLGPESTRFHRGDWSSDGRLLAIGSDHGAHIWDEASGAEILYLPMDSTYAVFFQPSSDELVTCGPEGLQIWPIQKVENTGDLGLGPPRKIWLPFDPLFASRSNDGRTLAVSGDQGEKSAAIIDLATESIKGFVYSPEGCEVVEFSPDGRWLATTSLGGGSGLRLWEVSTGTLMKHWEELTDARFYFAPDSRTIVISQPEGYSFWDMQTFKLIRNAAAPGVVRPGGVAFTLDGRLMAMELQRGVISLIEVATGRIVARLEDPYGVGEGAIGMSFNPAGTRLMFRPASTNAIHVWDLPAIRLQLKEQGIDWDWPEFSREESPREAGSLPRHTGRIEVSKASGIEPTANTKTTAYLLHAVKVEKARDRGDHSALVTALDHLRACYISQGRHAEAVSLLAESSVLTPNDTMLAEKVATLQAWFDQTEDHAATCRRVLGLAVGTDDPSVADRAAKAYCLLPSSDPELLQAAFTLAHRAVELGKDHVYLPYYQLALGMAEFRRSNYSAADSALHSAEDSGKDTSGVYQTARFFRAISLFRQGRKAEARRLFAETSALMKPLPMNEQERHPKNYKTQDLIIWLAYKEAKASLQSNTPPRQSPRHIR